MNNEIEEIVDLFDEFFIIDSPDQISSEQPIVESVSVPQPPAIELNEAEMIPPAVEPITTVEAPIEVSQPPLAPLNFSGANKRHIAVIYNDKNNDSRDNVEMLSNLITKALKFTMDDVAVVRLSKNPQHTLSDIIDSLHATHVMLWGGFDLLKQADNNTSTHQLTQINNAKVLVADWVHFYHNNTEHKTELWKSIQQLFADVL